MISEKLKPCSFFTKATILLLLLSQILKTYGFVSYWNFASIPTFFFASVYLAMIVLNKKKKKVDMPIELTLFFCYWIVVHIFSNIHGNLFPDTIIQIIISFVLFWGVISAEQIPRLIHYYRIIGAICIAFFFIQEIGYYSTGYRISGIFSFLPIALNSVDDVRSFLTDITTNTRSSSFFSEPAYFAQYIIPLLAIELFYDKSRYHYLYSAIILLAILLASTGSGLVGLSGVAIAYVFSLANNKKRIQQYLAGAFSILLLIVVGYVYLNTSIGDRLSGRKTELSFEYEGGSRSGFMRLYRGFYVFDTYSTHDKIFGNDNNQDIISHIMHSDVYDTFGERNDTFFNGYQYCLLRTGFIGLLILVVLIIRTVKNNSLCGKSIILSFACLMAVEAMFFGNNMILFLILSYRMKQINLSSNESSIYIKHSLR